MFHYSFFHFGLNLLYNFCMYFAYVFYIFMKNISRIYFAKFIEYIQNLFAKTQFRKGFKSHVFMSFRLRVIITIIELLQQPTYRLIDITITNMIFLHFSSVFANKLFGLTLVFFCIDFEKL